MVIGIKHLDGLSNMHKLTAALCLFFIFAFAGQLFSSSYKEIKLKDSYILTLVTPTIQTLAVFSKEYNGKMRILRGKIEFISIEEGVISGYLSTRYFKEDELFDLSEPNDKEGFFIIRLKDGNVISGLDGSTFFQKLENDYGYKDIEFLKPEQVRGAQ